MNHPYPCPPLKLHISRHQVRADVEGLLREVIVTVWGSLTILEEGVENPIDVSFIDALVPLTGFLELVSGEELRWVLIEEVLLTARERK